MVYIEKIKKRIFREVERFYRYTHKARFPGKYINYAGRVFNQEEMFLAVDSVLDFWLTVGRYAQKFEKGLAVFLGVKYCLLTNSGSSANLLAISALTSPELGKRKLSPGDEVITTACGFPTTLNPIIQNNLTPVFVDVKLGTYNIQVEKIEKAISKKTRAIFIAHTLGNPADIDRILKISRKYNLWFIEDNCDSLGSSYRGKYTGSFGHISTSSFYPAHHITTGEGGAVLTNDHSLKKIILSFRDWGRDCWCEPGVNNTCKKRFTQKFGDLPHGYDHKYVYSHIGYNLKITDIQAAIGVAQLRKLNAFIKIRQRNFSFLYRHLKKYGFYFILPQWRKDVKPSWFGFPLLVKDNTLFTRNEIVGYLEGKGIATRMLFGGNLTKQPAYKDTKCRISGSLNNTNQVMNGLFWIGVYPGIKNKDVKYICTAFDSFFKKRRGI